MQRYAFESVDDWVFDGTDEVYVERHEMLPRDYGDYYRAADVDALLARIRAAVEAEREARWEAACWSDDAGVARRAAAQDDAYAALDALLSEMSDA